MAKGGRFPLLYWSSILLLVLMVVFTAWYFYQNRNEICRNNISDTFVLNQLQRYWQQGQIIALMAPNEDAERVSAGMQTLLSDDFKLYAAAPDVSNAFGRTPQILPWLEACDSGVLAQIASLEPGNKVLLMGSGCMRNLIGELGEPGLALFLLQGEAEQTPKVLACAGPEDWPQE